MAYGSSNSSSSPPSKPYPNYLTSESSYSCDKIYASRRPTYHNSPLLSGLGNSFNHDDVVMLLGIISSRYVEFRGAFLAPLLAWLGPGSWVLSLGVAC